MTISLVVAQTAMSRAEIILDVRWSGLKGGGTHWHLTDL